MSQIIFWKALEDSFSTVVLLCSPLYSGHLQTSQAYQTSPEGPQPSTDEDPSLSSLSMPAGLGCLS